MERFHRGRSFGRLEFPGGWNSSAPCFGFSLLWARERIHLQVEFWHWRRCVAWRRV